MVVPKPLRDQVGLVPGEVEVVADGAGLYVEPIATGKLVEKDGLLIVAASGDTITDEQVQALRSRRIPCGPDSGRRAASRQR